MIIKGITKDALINILLTEREFKVVDFVPFCSKLGREIIEKHSLEWLYNNRYVGVSALDCVFQYYLLDNKGSERIRVNEYETMGIYENEYNMLTIDTINVNFERHSGTIEYFSTPKQLGYALDYRGTNLMFDIVVSNDAGIVKKTHCNKMWKNEEYSAFYQKWRLDKENFQETTYTGSSFLACISNYFMDIMRKTKPESIVQRDKAFFQKAVEKMDTSNSKQQIEAIIASELIDKKRIEIQQSYENERKPIE